MRAIYHPEYKTERELDDAIARLEQVILSGEETYLVDPSLIPAYREELLFDLANRRDDGELRWIIPSSWFIHYINEWHEDIKDILDMPSLLLATIPFKNKD